MSLMHATGSHAGRTIQARGTQSDGHGHNPAAADEAAHAACLETIRDLRMENEALRKSANEFAALAERLQRALVHERRRTARGGSKGSPDRFDGNHVLTISMQIEAEFRAIPNLRLTRWQAARLWDLEQEECDAAIAALVKSRVLRETPGGFMRRDR